MPSMCTGPSVSSRTRLAILNASTTPWQYPRGVILTTSIARSSLRAARGASSQSLWGLASLSAVGLGLRVHDAVGAERHRSGHLDVVADSCRGHEVDGCDIGAREVQVVDLDAEPRRPVTARGGPAAVRCDGCDVAVGVKRDDDRVEGEDARVRTRDPEVLRTVDVDMDHVMADLGNEAETKVDAATVEDRKWAILREGGRLGARPYPRKARWRW